jgi:lysophospholipase L1-like esterase
MFGSVSIIVPVQTEGSEPPAGLSPSDYVRSSEHEDAGFLASADITPRLANGTPDDSGIVGMISLGMSNAGIVSNRFSQLMFLTGGGDPDRHPAFRWVQGTQNSKTAESWSNPNDSCWANALGKVTTAGLAVPQIQAAWIMMTQKYPNVVYSGSTGAPMTETQMRTIVDNLLDVFPAVKALYISGLNYTGYSNNPELSFADRERAPEPHVHDDSILLTEMVLADDLPVWTDFYDFWANGEMANPLTGLLYTLADLTSDGVHPSIDGTIKMASSLKARFKADPVSAAWMFQ